MSIYIGDNTTEKVLHVYDGSTSVEKDNFSGTSFHSSLPYFTVKSRHRFTYNSTTPYSGTSGKWTWNSKGYTTTDEITTTTDFSIAIGYLNGTRYFFPAAAGVGVRFGTQYIPGLMYGNPFSNEPCFRISSGTTGYTATISNPSLLPAYPNLIFDYIDIIIFENVNEVIASDILINNSEISVNGNNVFDKEYLHFMDDINDTINDVDDIIAIPYGGSTFSYGEVVLKSNYVTSTGPTTFVNNRAGGHILLQVINSYDFPISSVYINSVNSTIGVVKNSVEIPIFNADSYFKTSYVPVAETLIVASGWTASANGTYFLKSVSIDLSSGGTIMMSTRIGNTAYGTEARILTVSPAINGKVFHPYAGGCSGVYMKAVVDTVNDKIYFYYVVQSTTINTPGVTYKLLENIYVQFTVMY